MRLINLIIFSLLLPSYLALGGNEKLLVVTTEHRSFQYQENGENKGLLIEELNQLLVESELTAEVLFMPWARAYDTVINRPNTLVLGIIRTESRENKLHWIMPLAQVVRIYIALADKPNNHVKNDQQAKQKRVGVIRNSFAHNELMSRGFVEGENLYVVSTLNNLFNLFTRGRIDLVYADPRVVKKYTQNTQYHNIKLYYQSFDNIMVEKDAYIAANLSTDLVILERLSQAAAKLSLR